MVLSSRAIDGLSGATISFHGDFTRGVSLRTSNHDDRVLVSGLTGLAPHRTVTAVYAMAGDDDVTIKVPPEHARGALLVCHAGPGNDKVLAGRSRAPLVLLGGAGDDVVQPGGEGDAVFGDEGSVDFPTGDSVGTTMTAPLSGVAALPSRIASIASEADGGDTIAPEPHVLESWRLSGSDVVIGGGGFDAISAGAGTDATFADHGEVSYDAGGGGVYRTAHATASAAAPAPNAEPHADARRAAGDAPTLQGGAGQGVVFAAGRGGSITSNSSFVGLSAARWLAPVDPLVNGRGALAAAQVAAGMRAVGAEAFAGAPLKTVLLPDGAAP